MEGGPVKRVLRAAVLACRVPGRPVPSTTRGGYRIMGRGNDSPIQRIFTRQPRRVPADLLPRADRSDIEGYKLLQPHYVTDRLVLTIN